MSDNCVLKTAEESQRQQRAAAAREEKMRGLANTKVIDSS
jgi:hypothetical protein